CAREFPINGVAPITSNDQPEHSLMSRKQLTSKQHEFLHFLVEHVRLHGVGPTYRELVDRSGDRSSNCHTQHLPAFYNRRYLTRSHAAYLLVDTDARRWQARVIPLRATITAGRSPEPVDADLGTLALKTVFPNLDRIFAIRVSGHSMTG